MKNIIRLKPHPNFKQLENRASEITDNCDDLETLGLESNCHTTEFRKKAISKALTNLEGTTQKAASKRKHSENGNDGGDARPVCTSLN